MVGRDQPVAVAVRPVKRCKEGHVQWLDWSSRSFHRVWAQADSSSISCYTTSSPRFSRLICRPLFYKYLSAFYPSLHAALHLPCTKGGKGDPPRWYYFAFEGSRHGSFHPALSPQSTTPLARDLMLFRVSSSQEHASWVRHFLQNDDIKAVQLTYSEPTDCPYDDVEFLTKILRDSAHTAVKPQFVPAFRRVESSPAKKITAWLVDESTGSTWLQRGGKCWTRNVARTEKEHVEQRKHVQRAWMDHSQRVQSMSADATPRNPVSGVSLYSPTLITPPFMKAQRSASGMVRSKSPISPIRRPSFDPRDPYEILSGASSACQARKNQLERSPSTSGDRSQSTPMLSCKEPSVVFSGRSTTPGSHVLEVELAEREDRLEELTKEAEMKREQLLQHKQQCEQRERELARRQMEIEAARRNRKKELLSTYEDDMDEWRSAMQSEVKQQWEQVQQRLKEEMAAKEQRYNEQQKRIADLEERLRQKRAKRIAENRIPSQSEFTLESELQGLIQAASTF